MIALLLTLTFANGECPWDEVTSVTAAPNYLTINEIDYPINGGYNRKKFASTLLSCGEDKAERLFQVWRTQQNWAVGTGITSLFLLWPLAIYSGITFAAQPTRRRVLVRELEGKS